MLSSAVAGGIQYPAGVIYQTQIFLLMNTKSEMVGPKSETRWQGFNGWTAPVSPLSLNITWIYMSH